MKRAQSDNSFSSSSPDLDVIGITASKSTCSSWIIVMNASQQTRTAQGRRIFTILLGIHSGSPYGRDRTSGRLRGARVIPAIHWLPSGRGYVPDLRRHRRAWDRRYCAPGLFAQEGRCCAWSTRTRSDMGRTGCSRWREWAGGSWLDEGVIVRAPRGRNCRGRQALIGKSFRWLGSNSPGYHAGERIADSVWQRPGRNFPSARFLRV